MILRSSPPSPFGRKVKIAAHMLGLMDRIEVVTANTRDPADSLRRQNPLGKIPILVLDDGTAIYDSRVICAYLDQRAGGGKIVPDGAAHWPAMTMQALGDGIMDANILLTYEVRFRPEEVRHPPWMDYQREKVARTLAVLEEAPPKLDGTPHIGHIAVACALGHLDFRFEGAWRAGHPNMVRWLTEFETLVPAYAQTMPHD